MELVSLFLLHVELVKMCVNWPSPNTRVIEKEEKDDNYMKMLVFYDVKK